MPEEQYKHIFLSGPTRTRGFTNPQKGGSAPRIPDRDRYNHSDYLKRRFETAWAISFQHYVVIMDLA
ncbi:MAG: hypothetical protein HQK98_08325 [Nitrospirae bacterium]|nr:hypothetical protein [Nitrospirota bacterium]